MATCKDYMNYVIEQLSDLEEITYRMMMGEYIIYYRGRIAAYVCDNRLLVKPVSSAKKLMPNARYELPYEGAKPMLLVDNIDNKDFLTLLFESIYDELDIPKKRKKRNGMD